MQVKYTWYCSLQYSYNHQLVPKKLWQRDNLHNCHGAMLIQLNSFRRLLLITFSSLFAVWTILSLAFSFKVEATNRKGIQLNIFLTCLHFVKYSTPPSLCNTSFYTFSISNLDQIESPMTVMESESKTCSIWWSFGWDIQSMTFSESSRQANSKTIPRSLNLVKNSLKGNAKISEETMKSLIENKFWSGINCI